MYILITVK